MFSAQLWIGAPRQLAQQANQFLQTQFCKNLNPKNLLNQDPNFSNTNLDLNCTCNACKQINQQQHAQILFINPESSYTVDTIKPILEQIVYRLDSNQKFFFVLSQVDQLSTVCANLLLKSLEEPPAGYYFILLAQRYYQVLPTIKSRCNISYFSNNTIINHTLTNNIPISSPTNQLASASPESFTTNTFAPVNFETRSHQDPLSPIPAHPERQSREIYEILTHQKSCSQEQFLQLINKLSLSDLEQIALLDQIILYWSQLYKQNLYTQNNFTPVKFTLAPANSPATETQLLTTKSNNFKLEQLAQFVNLLNQQLLQPPVRGSAKIFWRNLFMQLHQILALPTT